MTASSRFGAATVGVLVLVSCALHSASPAVWRDPTRVDVDAIAALARELSADEMRGRGPWTPENERAARRLAEELQRLGARPVFGDGLLVPFVAAARPRDTVFNVVGVLAGRGEATSGELVGITAHFDHLGVGEPDTAGDSTYNGFLDAAVPVAMVLDVARRYARFPGDRPLAVMLFNLEEQGLLGSRALLARADAPELLGRLRLVIGVDAGSPAGEALQWQLMGAVPDHPGARLADSLARARGWTTTPSAPRPISDVSTFSAHGVAILFPIPGRAWKGYTAAQRDEAMRRFDHYHRPADEWRAEWPWEGTASFADWLWTIVREASNRRAALR